MFLNLGIYCFFLQLITIVPRGIRYNRKGNRIVFLDKAGLHVIDLASFNSVGMIEGKKKLTSSDQNDNHWTEHAGNFCFAGENDGLIVAASHHRGLLVWYMFPTLVLIPMKSTRKKRYIIIKIMIF
jgi:hypothetical protein